MTPAILNLALFGIEEVVKLAPGLVSELQAIFSTGTPTADQFAALRAKVNSESYAQFVPSSALPAASATASAAESTPTVL